MSLGRTAAADGAELLAYERTNPIVLRGTDTTLGDHAWTSDSSGTLTPTAAGATATAHVEIPYGVKG